MKNWVIAVVGTVAVVTTVASFAAYVAITRRELAPREPLAGYGQVDEAEARAIGERVADGFAEHDGSAFDALLDAEAFALRVIGKMVIGSSTRAAYVKGMVQGLSAPGKGMGAGIAGALPAEPRVRLLSTPVVEGWRRARLRILSEKGVNYLDLVLARTPAGEARIVDFFGFYTGELGSETVRTASAALWLDNPVTRILAGLVGMKVEKPEVAAEAVTAVRKLTALGEYREALASWEKLPAAFRNSRAGVVMRLAAAQGIGGDEYRKVLEEVARDHAGDPTLALALLDRYAGGIDPAGELRCLDGVDQAVGGDPYLATLRGRALLALGRAADARAVLAAAMRAEPELADLWWAALDVSLAVHDHGETERLLHEVESEHGIEIGDLTKIADYGDFVRSAAYRRWKSRPRVPAAVGAAAVP